MAEMANSVGVIPRTITAGAAAIARGLRCVLNAGGTCDLAGAAVRGDMVSAVDLAIGETGPAYETSGGGKVPAVAAVAVAVGDPAYSAANGRFTNVSTGAALLGRWALAASGAGVLGEVELESLA